MAKLHIGVIGQGLPMADKVSKLIRCSGCEYLYPNGNCLKTGGFYSSIADKDCVKVGKKMITPIRTMTIDQIMERPDDLLIGRTDLAKLDKGTKNKVIDEFVTRLKAKVSEAKATMISEDWGIVSIGQIEEIANQMKGELDEKYREED